MTHLRRIATEGVSSGFYCIDSRTKGLAPGELIIMAATRPEMGVHVLVMNIAEHIATQEELPVCVFLTEKGATQTTLSLLSSVDPLLSEGKADVAADAEDGTIPTEKSMIASVGSLVIHETPGITLSEFKIISQRSARQYGPLGLLVLDSMQFMCHEGSTSAEGVTDHSTTVKDLKNLSVELQCPVIVTFQLKQEIEKRTYKRPKMSDLRQWGTLDAEADMVIILYRDDYYHPNSVLPCIVDVNFLKNPRGNNGKHYMAFVNKPVPKMFCVVAEDTVDWD